MDSPTALPLIPIPGLMENDGKSQHHPRRRFLLEGRIPLGRPAVPRRGSTRQHDRFYLETRNSRILIHRCRNLEEQYSALVVQASKPRSECLSSLHSRCFPCAGYWGLDNCQSQTRESGELECDTSRNEIQSWAK